ncbi:SfnB family sulfur acquisition oxidoreductase [Bradyrhizobium uaiense]|uniref:SfnB family sulfur acquisition oxidoreductase n=1 Tax=Bradyrhizobium uaiense TaxID=2594946 RepID=A0A6P1BI71_9BRAD|nr:SfnB family sulfur acquisition oxidoreductase [Bradyrhizobium uaiense]NEU97919.1 SfnB family sulfur acquisition oxidoreductase [Bradyrhizobium uaiense]
MNVVPTKKPLDEAASRKPAHVIRTADEALTIARELAPLLAAGASERDSQRRLPHDELRQFVQSGLWGIGIRSEYGGAGVSIETIIEVVAIISAADPSIGQLPQSNYLLLESLHHIGTEPQKRFFLSEVLTGKVIGNAFAESGGKNVLDIRSRISRTPSGLRLNARKVYGTNALFADWIPISGVDDDGNVVYVYVPHNAAGLSVLDDWNGFGQRTSASGTVIADNVEVNPAHVIARYKSIGRPSLTGPFAQLLHVAIDLGIARASFAEAVRLARSASRPWIDSGLQRAQDDPHTIATLGDLQIRVHAADAMVARAARTLDAVRDRHDEADVARASVAVAEAKVPANDVALFASSKLFEFGGASSARTNLNLDRHWRNARTHTLHDPVRWKYHLIGNYVLNDKNPPLHIWA